jgi:hypothetical protein
VGEVLLGADPADLLWAWVAGLASEMGRDPVSIADAQELLRWLQTVPRDDREWFMRTAVRTAPDPEGLQVSLETFSKALSAARIREAACPGDERGRRLYVLARTAYRHPTRVPASDPAWRGILARMAKVDRSLGRRWFAHLVADHDEDRSLRKGDLFDAKEDTPEGAADLSFAAMVRQAAGEILLWALHHRTMVDDGPGKDDPFPSLTEGKGEDWSFEAKVAAGLLARYDRRIHRRLRERLKEIAGDALDGFDRDEVEYLKSKVFSLPARNVNKLRKDIVETAERVSELSGRLAAWKEASSES